MHAFAAAPPMPVPAPLRRALHLLPLLAVIALLATPPLGGEGSATAADAACGVLVVWALVRVLREGVRPLTRTAALVMGLPVAGICVAAMGAADPGTAVAGLGRYLQIFVLVPLAVLLLLRDGDDFRLAAAAVVALALFEGGVGVVQYATSTGASYMGEDIRAVGTFGASDIMGMATVVSCGLLCSVGLALDPSPSSQLRSSRETPTPARAVAGAGPPSPARRSCCFRSPCRSAGAPGSRRPSRPARCCCSPGCAGRWPSSR